MSNTMAVAQGSKSPLAVSKKADGTFEIPQEAQQAIFGKKSLLTGSWSSFPTMSRLRITGTGALSIDSRDSAGVVTSAVFAGNYNAVTEKIEFPFYGNSAVQIRATFPNTLTVEVI